MIIFKRFAIPFVLICAWLGGEALAASRAPSAVNPPLLDVATLTDGASLGASMIWCRTDPSVILPELLSRGCDWQPLVLSEVVGRVDDAAYWMRINLVNRSAVPVERWIKLGHTRINHRTMYLHRDGRWSRQDTGLDVPLDRRSNNFAASRGFFVADIPAEQTVEVVLRLETTAWIDLRSEILEPELAVRSVERRELLVHLAAGGLLLGIMFGLLLFVRTGQSVYASFVVALLGETLIELHRTGVLQAQFWPTSLPVPSAVMPMGGALTLLGWSSFLFFFFPVLRRYRRTLLVCAVLIAVQVIAQVWSIAVDFRMGLYAWSYLFLPTQLCGAYLCWLAVRGAGTEQRVLAGLLLVIFLFGIVRVVFSQTFDESHMVALEVAPLALILGMPLVLFALTESTRELRMQLTRAEARSAGQVEFLARMSHELRTPLDTVLGNAQLLLRSGRLGEAGTEGLRSIIASAKHLLGMIDEILNYARGLSGALTLRPEPFYLTEFIRTVELTAQIFTARNRNRFVLQRRTGSLDVQGLIVLIDASRLRQVLDNLLVNAARHTREGLITLNYGVSRLDSATVRLTFTVSDTGEGIAPEDQERIFLPFERVGRHTRAAGKGAGMGLTTAKQLVNLMGGSLSVTSELGRGASFSFGVDAPIGCIDDVVSLIDDTRPISAIGYHGERRTVLVVDDEPAARRLLVSLLTRLGFEVLEAESGRTAAEMIQSPTSLHLVITDQFMADGDGWDVLDAVRQSRPEIPAVLISAAPPSPPDGWPLNSGFTTSFLKPVDHDALLRRIGELLDLQWVQGNATPESRSAQVVRPPPPELQSLGRMVDLGEVTAIREWAQQLRRDYPQCTDFADRIEQAINMLDFKSIESLLGRASR